MEVVAVGDAATVAAEVAVAEAGATEAAKRVATRSCVYRRQVQMQQRTNGRALARTLKLQQTDMFFHGSLSRVRSCSHHILLLLYFYLLWSRQ